MHLASIHTYPVKALRGGDVPAVDIDPCGPRGDRRWMIVDAEAMFLTQRQHPLLATIAAHATPTGLALTDAAGETLEVTTPGAGAARCHVTVWRDSVPARLADAAAHDWLGARLGIPCALVHLDDPAARPVNPAFATGGDCVSFADGFPLLLVTTASLADLNARLATPIPIGRFRPNLVITNDSPWEEDGWRRLRIGAAIFRVAKPCERCVVTTIDPATGQRPEPAEPLRTLGTFRRDAGGGVMFGQNLIPEQLGRVRAGDAVEVLERGPPNVRLVSPARQSGAWPMRVERIEPLSADVRRLVLRPCADGQFANRPGQYVTLLLPGGARRSLSPACAPRGDGVLEFHVRRRAGGVLTGFVFDTGRPGDRLEVEGPYGDCVLAESGDGLLMLATSTGLAPMLALLEANFAAPRPRPATLFWGGRTQADLYDVPALQAWSGARADFRFLPVLSSRGLRVQDAAAAAFADLSGIDIYACGAPAMVADARTRLLAIPGAQAARFHADAFAPALPAVTAAEAPAIALRLEGPAPRAVRAPVGATLLAGLLGAGVPVAAVCGGHASCGTCRIRLAPAWQDRLGPPERTERRLLGCLPDPDPAHRLACQIALRAEDAGLAFSLAPA